MSYSGIKNISIFASIYNTLPNHFEEALHSFQLQIGIIDCELIIIDDGSEEKNSEQYILLLNNLKQECSFIKEIIYKKLDQNKGVGFCANQAVLLCNNEIIFRMDTDDIMNPYRIQLQYNFMIQNPNCMLCTGDIRSFRTVNNNNKNKNK